MAIALSPLDKEIVKPPDVDGGVTEKLPSLPVDPLEEVSITFRYLTFETVLPNVPDDDACVPPNLARYASPFTWPASQKNIIVLLSCVGTSFTAYSAGSYSPAFTQLSKAWHVGETALSIGLTTYCVGFAIAPMVLAPFSELNGRRPVFVISGLLFTVCQLCCAVTRSFAGMLVARFFVGMGASMFGAGVGGVLADILVAEERNTAMALFSGSVLFGSGFGPMVSGSIAEYSSWRWIFYSQVIANTVLVVALSLGFRETRGAVLLSRKAHALNAWYEAREHAGLSPIAIEDESNGGSRLRLRWKVQSDEERASARKILTVSLTRPFYLLATEPVVFFFSLWASMAWAVLYMSFASIPLVFSTHHGFNLAQSGAVFSAMSVGAFLATVLGLLGESYRKKRQRTSGDTQHNPEARLYFSCIGSALLPIGMLWYGWTSFSDIPWIVPTLAVGCYTMGIYFIYLSVFNYLADTYGRHASSAIAAQSFCRNMFAGILPIVNNIMFRKLTYQGAGSFLAGVGFLLTLVPWVLVFYGPRIRGRSKFAASNAN